MWYASIAGWMLSNVLNSIEEATMKVIEKMNNYINIEIIATAVVGAGALLYGDVSFTITVPDRRIDNPKRAPQMESSVCHPRHL